MSINVFGHGSLRTFCSFGKPLLLKKQEGTDKIYIKLIEKKKSIHQIKDYENLLLKYISLQEVVEFNHGMKKSMD